MNKTPVTLLIIDPDAASRNYLTAMLTREGFTVLSAAAGREGLITAWKDQPEIIIFDPYLPDLKGVDLVTRLRQDRRTANVLCLALSSREEPEGMAALLAAGCNEFMIKSGNTLQQILKFLPNPQGIVQKPHKRGRTIVFLSAKGGLGTSSLCANLATLAAQANPEKTVAVFDLVLPLGSIASIVGSDDRVNIITAAMLSPEMITAEYFSEKLPGIPGWNFHLLAGSQDPASTGQLNPDRINLIVNAMQGAFDYLFMDLGRTLSRISLPIIQQANAFVLVLGTDLATGALTRTLVEYLRTLGVETERFFAIQNRSVGLEGLSRPEVEKLIGIPVRLTLPYLGENLTVANNRHEPFTSRNPDDATTMTLKDIAAQIIELAEKLQR